MIENDSFKTDIYIYIYKISKTIDNICDEDPAYKLYIYIYDYACYQPFFERADAREGMAAPTACGRTWGCQDG